KHSSLRAKRSVAKQSPKRSGDCFVPRNDELSNTELFNNNKNRRKPKILQFQRVDKKQFLNKLNFRKMKKVLYTAALAVLVMATGCKKENPDLTTDIVGTYIGTGTSSGIGRPAKVDIAKVNDKMVTVTLSFQDAGIWYQL